MPRIEYNGVSYDVPAIPYNCVLLEDVAQQTPIVEPVDGTDLTLKFVTHAGATLDDMTRTVDATYSLRRAFLNDLGKAMQAILDGTASTPLTVEPDGTAPASHPRAVIDQATVGGRPKLAVTFQSRPTHAVLATHYLDAWPYAKPYKSYARACGERFAEERSFTV